MTTSRKSLSPASRLSRMREMFDTELAILAEDYAHFTQPLHPLLDAPTPRNKA